MTTAVNTDVAVVQGMFEAFAKGDLATFADGFHADATWNHRNPDRLGGVHAGIDAIMAFLADSGRLTAGTLRAVPTGALSDDAGHVAVPVTVSGSRPDGRTSRTGRSCPSPSSTGGSRAQTSTSAIRPR